MRHSILSVWEAQILDERSIEPIAELLDGLFDLSVEYFVGA